AEDGIRDFHVTGVQTCALPIYQGQAFAQVDGDGRQALFPQNFGGGLFSALVDDVAFADQVKRQVGKLHEVATGTHATVPVDDRRSEERRVGTECRRGGRARRGR